MDKLILGILGEKFAGKDVVANYLVQAHGAEHFRFSHILDDILKMLNLEISRRNEVDLGLGLRQIFGGQVLGPAIAKKVKESSKSLIVVNGIRMDEFDVIKALGAKIIYITAPSEIRFVRYQQRHEKTDDATLDYESFMKQEQGATEVNIPELGKLADYKIENTGLLAELHEKIEAVLTQIKKA